MTGTPAGVGDVVLGGHICISCGDLLPCDFVIGPSDIVKSKAKDSMT